LLRYYSPLKVAETFLTIEALYPGRIDLGVCKGPGAFAATAEVLVDGNKQELEEGIFEQKVADLIDYLRQAPPAPDWSASDPSEQGVVKAYPWGVTPPPVWVLGSGTKSMKLASQLGTSYSFTLFFDSRQTYGPGLMEDYQRQFSPSPEQAIPCTSIAVSMICLEDEVDALAYEAKMVMEGSLPSTIVGNPRHCFERLHELAVRYNTNEILVATWLQNYEDRANLYRWLAEYNQSYGEVYERTTESEKVSQ
jgi:alkanesulfonate monooxygenase SsuD/methylene tetrahydromethanopterin reductase-like flavin-dependent oxidoreductase (luciferase family)